MRRYLVFAVSLAVLASGCAKSGPTAGSTSAPEKGPQTRVVEVDATGTGYHAFALAYFPNEVTVRAGDTVSFDPEWTGEPHSVTMGAAVDAVIPAAAALPRGAEPPADLAKKFEALPAMFPEGPGDANQVAVNPCYLDSGEIPSDGTKACPKTDQPAFDGKQVYYNSGYLDKSAKFDVKLADSIAPGSYAYYCNLHGAGMSGKINVVDADASIPTADEVNEQAKADKAKFFDKLDVLHKSVSEKLPYQAVAGFGSPDIGPAAINDFLPAELKIKAGEKVTWNSFGPHTVSFNAPEEAEYAVVKAKDGTFHMNPVALGPSNSPAVPPPGAPEAGGAETSGPPQPKETIDGGNVDDKTFKSSGLLFNPGSPGYYAYTVTFPTAGTYAFVCLIHPHMTGKVKVS